jgi:hypothetical protein
MILGLCILKIQSFASAKVSDQFNIIQYFKNKYSDSIYYKNLENGKIDKRFRSSTYDVIKDIKPGEELSPEFSRDQNLTSIYSNLNNLKVIYGKTADYYYQEIFNHSGILYGYNIIGVCILTNASNYEGIYSGLFISDPHVIDKNGNVLFKNELVIKIINHDVVITGLPNVMHLNLSEIPYGSAYQKIGYYDIKSYFISKYNESITNRIRLFKINNSADNEDQKINELNLLSATTKQDTVSQYFTFSNCKDCPIGILNIKGEIVFDQQFKTVKWIKKIKGVDYFLAEKQQPDGIKLGIVTSDGRYVFEPTLDYIETDNMTDINDSKIKFQYKGLFGLLNEEFEIFIEPKYRELKLINNKFAIIEQYASEYKEKIDFINLQTKKELGLNIQELSLSNYKFGEQNNIIPVKINNKWGYTNDQGQILITPKYSFVTEFNESIAIVFLLTSNNDINSLRKPRYSQQGFVISRTGLILAALDKELSNDIISLSEFHEGLALFKSRETGKYGYINKKGAIAIKPIYEDASNFFGGMAQVKRIGTSFYIDKNGNRRN